MGKEIRLTHLGLVFILGLFGLAHSSYLAHPIVEINHHIPFAFKAVYLMGHAEDSTELKCPDGVKLDARVFRPGFFGNITSGPFARPAIGGSSGWLCGRIATKADSEYVAKVNPRGLLLDSISRHFEVYKGCEYIPFPAIQHTMSLDFAIKNRSIYNRPSSSNYVIWPLTDSLWVQACIRVNFRVKCNYGKSKEYKIDWKLGTSSFCQLLDPDNEHPEENVRYRIGTAVTRNYKSPFNQSQEKWLDSTFSEMPELEFIQLEERLVLIHYRWWKKQHRYDYFVVTNHLGQSGWNAIYDTYRNSETDYQSHEMGVKDGLFRIESKVAKPDGSVRTIKVKWDGGPKADY